MAITLSPTDLCSFRDCGLPVRYNKLCNSHAEQKRLGRTLAVIKSRPSGLTVSERFWSKVNFTMYCWEWTAAKDSAGYGRLNRKTYGYHTTHRYAYYETFDTIDHNRVIDHRCFNPSCVNPLHLREATVKENSENRVGAQRNSSRGSRGVYYNSTEGKYFAKLVHNGKQYHGGYYATKAEATVAARNLRNTIFTYNEKDALDDH